MEIRDFVLNLAKEDGMRSYYLFETLVYKLLERHLEKQSKKIILYEESNSPFDFYLEKGINENNFPIGAIIKFVKRNNNSYFASIRRSFEKITIPPSMQGIIVIFGDDISIKVKTELKTYIEKLTNIRAEIWDFENLNQIIRDNNEYFLEIFNNIDKILINTVVEKGLETKAYNWNQKRNDITKNLKEAYKNEDLVLFLGAGVSKEAQIPDWNVLVTDLLVSMISEKLRDKDIQLNNSEQVWIIDQIKKRSDSSPLLQARYIRTGLKDKFPEMVAESLYRNIIDGEGGSSNLLKAITRTCTPKRSSIGIRAVITYNFDDLLEYHLKDSNIKHSPIFRETDTFCKDELPIYHVHGYLPRESNEYYNSSENLIVFSEEGYHAMMLDPYCWSNITQLNCLRENTCLMVGLSITDPNLRRLLAIAARKIEHPRHVAILKRQTITKIIINENEGNEAIESFNVVDRELQEASFKELGINVLWVDDYEEIPNILDSICK